MPRTKKPPVPESVGFSAKVLAGAVASGQRARETLDNPQQGLFFSKLFQTPTDDETEWRNLSLDSQSLDRMAPADLLNRLANLSPDLSRALWDFLRMTNPGHKVVCYGADGKAMDKRAQASVDAFVSRLNARYGSIDVVIHRLFLNAFLRGGFFAEVVFGSGGQAIDIATPDSRYLYFERDLDPDYGLIWRPFQWQAGIKRYLDVPTVRYVPVDPLPGSPYGRAPAQPALFTILFTMGLLRDLRRVVAQQGYPRLDIAMDLDQLLKKMPQEAKASIKEQDVWLRDMQTQISQHYACLQPEDAYIHTSDITMNRPLGTVDSSSLGAVDGLIAALDRMAVRALKSMPLLFGISDGVSEANANRQWEVHIAGLKALQHLAEGLLAYFCTLALQAEGLQATAEWRFSEVRASEELRDAQTENQKLRNVALKFWLGLIDLNAAAVEMGLAKADQQTPRLAGVGVQAGGGGAGTNPGGVQADPGSARALEVLHDIEAGPGAVDFEAIMADMQKHIRERGRNGNGNGRHP